MGKITGISNLVSWTHKDQEQSSSLSFSHSYQQAAVDLDGTFSFQANILHFWFVLDF